MVDQSLRDRPARCSASASSARASSLPAAMSRSSCASQLAASKAANHLRKLASSLADKLLMSRSSFSILVIAQEIYENEGRSANDSAVSCERQLQQRRGYQHFVPSDQMPCEQTQRLLTWSRSSAASAC